MNFKDLFNNQQKILELELAVARTRFEHLGLRGNALEIASRDFFEKHLPRSISVGTGEVIALESDRSEARSGQIDLVFSNQSQPFLTPRDVPTVFFIEGVLAAGEVKARLTRSMMPDELLKAQKFRALRAKNMSRLVHVANPDNWSSYYVFYRPYFIVAAETKSPWQVIMLELMEYIEKERVLPLDGIFLLDQGAVIIVSPHPEAPFTQMTGIPFEHNIGDKQGTGFILPYNTSTPLAFLMAWLSLFRTSFFEDKQPISLYLQDMVNSSLQEMTPSESHSTAEELMHQIEKSGLWHFSLDTLRAKYPKRRQQS